MGKSERRATYFKHYLNHNNTVANMCQISVVYVASGDAEALVYCILR